MVVALMRDGAERDNDLVEDTSYLHTSSLPSAQLRTGAGTHTPWLLDFEWSELILSANNQQRWLWVPAFAGDDNEKLRAQLAEREPTVTGKTDEPLPKADSLKKPEPKVAENERKIEIPLPSDRDMDRVMAFLEQAWRRLIEMANRMQKDVTGKI